MKSVSIIAIAIFALVAVSSSVPIVNQQAEAEAQARFDVYNDFLAGLFSGLVQTTFGSISSFLDQLITENPLGVGKRDAQSDLAARVDIFSFLYDNILQDLFSGLVSNTFNQLTSTLTNLIQTNPLGVGKRDVEDDLVARVDLLSFLYDNILQDLFSGLVSNTFNTISGALNNLIQTNPLGIGKRADGINIFQFLNDNIFAELLGGLASNTANYLQNALQGLLGGIGKRADGINIFQFLNENIFAELFGTLASNTSNYLQNALQSLLGGIGKRSVNLDQANTVIVQTVSTLIEKFKTFAHQAVALKDREQLADLVKNTIADIKVTIAQLAHQLAELVPSAISNGVSEVLALLQSTLIFWTSGLGGSLGPVIGPFRP